jgi:hypothetical protein
LDGADLSAEAGWVDFGESGVQGGVVVGVQGVGVVAGESGVGGRALVVGFGDFGAVAGLGGEFLLGEEQVVQDRLQGPQFVE